ncbi:MAG: hypothetical protein NC038_06785 [Paludibacter sp.]|nr:hypothetical protein [Bacteroidales bacterium]MCM1069606.1 hypothetical protein [Prevotella sp.]MCM1354252.1 hypothetical protein [Bacteroides sp.]MCM1443091.1 hypothetical protein [Muribaculum sp.]MCM1482326.1 hypothetical protein [Paludibacter sp.]
MPKKILILSDGYNKPLYGPRMTQLCKYLSRAGWDITVVTEQMVSESYTIPYAHFLAMPYYSTNRWVKRWRWIADKLFHWKDRMLYRHILKNIKDLSSYSLILCSTFNLFPLLAAEKIAKKTHLPLVVDLRDITEQWGHSNYFAHNLYIPRPLKRYLISLFEHSVIHHRNSIIKHAAAVTTISPWHQHLLQKIAPNTHLIYNGFDPETYTYIAQHTDQCIISYCGRFYDFQSRNPQAFLDALSLLHQSQCVTPETLHVVFHIEPHYVLPLKNWVNTYNLQAYFTIEDYIPHAQAVELLQQSSISLLFAASPSPMAPRSIMTTKFFEALGCEKPILCIPSDEGVLAETIQRTNAGIASADIEEIKNFIIDKYTEWQANGYTHQSVCDKETFSREYQALQFEQIFLNILSEQSQHE